MTERIPKEAMQALDIIKELLGSSVAAVYLLILSLLKEGYNNESS